MLQTVIMTLAALVIAICGGGLSAWYALDMTHRLDALRVGPWVAYPSEGTQEANPYAKARMARNGDLPLGAAEGIRFIALEDTAGAPLRANCSYVVAGELPIARLWTLYPSTDAISEPDAGPERMRVLHSRSVLYESEGSVRIHTGPRPQPGNWLAHDGKNPLALVLTLYDTPVAANSSIAEIVLPDIKQVRCDD